MNSFPSCIFLILFHYFKVVCSLYIGCTQLIGVIGRGAMNMDEQISVDFEAETCEDMPRRSIVESLG